MAAKSDQSQTAQTTSTTNTTNNVTETLSDSFNRTFNYVTNTSVTEGAKGIPTWILVALVGGGSIFFLFVIAIIKR